MGVLDLVGNRGPNNAVTSAIRAFEGAFRILQVSSSDIQGGASMVAWNLFRAYRARGNGAILAVGRKYSHDVDVLPFGDYEPGGSWSRFWWKLYRRLEPQGRRGVAVSLARATAHGLARPGKLLDTCRGVEDFRFPSTWNLLDLTRQRPDIVHCHNLHGGYFDLRALSWLSRQVPLVLTVHDAWLLSGHCAHSFDCERWKTGCGECPDLSIPPKIWRDATAHNWRRKRDIYSQSRLYVAAPSQWLMDKVKPSILARALVGTRVIPNGVDQNLFHRGDKPGAREALGLPSDHKILLFVAHGILRNPFKDFATMKAAIELLAHRPFEQKILFIALGEEPQTERIGRAELRFVPYQSDPEVVARYYQAADLYLHVANVETFPNTVIEALASGTPVVATAVGGIPEQVKGLRGVSELRAGEPRWNEHGSDEATGFLAPSGDAQRLAQGMEHLLHDEALCSRLGENAARDARERFGLDKQAERYLSWYREILSNMP